MGDIITTLPYPVKIFLNNNLTKKKKDAIIAFVCIYFRKSSLLFLSQIFTLVIRDIDKPSARLPQPNQEKFQ